MTGGIIRIIGNSLALYLASLIVSGFIIQGGAKNYLIAGVALGLLNLIVKPIIKALSMPFVILTFLLFLLVINAVILWLVDYFLPFVIIQDVSALIFATIVIAIVNFFIHIFSKTL